MLITALLAFYLQLFAGKDLCFAPPINRLIHRDPGLRWSLGNMGLAAA